jgi:hypothetical protein
MSLYDGTNGPLIKVYIDNGGLTPSAFVLGVSTLAVGTSIPITSGTGNGTSITFNVTNSFTVGQTAKVAGFGVGSGVSLNGTYIIASRTATTFTVTSTKVGTTSGTGGVIIGDQLTTNLPYQSLVQIPSTDVRSISIRRGRTREDQTFQPGTMTVTLDNWSGVYDPQMLNSTFSFNGYSFFVAGRPMRVTATWSGTEYTLYSGYIEQIDLDQSLNPTVTITCVDLLAQLGKVNVTGTFGSWFILGGQFNYASFATAYNSICAAAQLNSTLYTANGTLQAWVPYQTSQTALSVLESLAQSQGGRSFVNRSGVLTGQGYDYIVPGSSSLNFSDQRTSGTIEYDDIAITPGSKYLRNQVILQGWQTPYSGSSSVLGTYTNTISAQQNGLISATVLTFGNVTNDSTNFNTIGQYLADHFATNAYRVDSLSFDVMNLNGFGGSVWAGFLGLELGQLVTVARTPVYTSAQNYNCLVQAINHDISPTGWRTSLNLSPAN